jgi:glycerol-3-phosphate dehydrogenase (NAD(P)+)
LALLLAKKGVEVPLWGHDPAQVASLCADRLNAKYLPGVKLPPEIRPTNDLSECAAAGVIVIAVPSKHLGAVAAQLATVLPGKGTLVSCTKGIEQERGLLMSEVISEKILGATLAVFSGPNLAGEIGRGLPAAGVIGCVDPEVLSAVQALFEGTGFRAYTSSDVRGIQLGGALKNVFAIAAGVSDGLGLGENARAGLVTRALAEMSRLGVAMGGHRETFRGLSGIGDLMLTCFSAQSRNHQVGFRLGRGETLDQISASMTMVAEGVPTAASAQACARRLGVETPIIDEVEALLHGRKTPSQAMKSLMSRGLKAEEI